MAKKASTNKLHRGTQPRFFMCKIIRAGVDSFNEIAILNL